MWWSFQVFLGAESPRRTGNGWKNVEENKVQSANAQVSNSVIFRIKCRAQAEDVFRTEMSPLGSAITPSIFDIYNRGKILRIDN